MIHLGSADGCGKMTPPGGLGDLMQIRPPSAARATALAVVLIVASAATSATSVDAVTQGARTHTALGVNVRTHQAPGAMPRSTSALRPATISPPGSHLTYYGGPVLTGIKSVDVLWGSGSYQPFVSGTYMAQFTNQYLGSGVMDWLTEYNTPASGGTGQAIGRGSNVGHVTITPSVTSATIQDTQIPTELHNQIAAGHLPAPDDNTSYAIFFPQGKTICQGGSCSGEAGGFCAYHGTFTYGSVVATYQVMPDNQAGSGDATGCGNGTPMANETSVFSHELVETITDPQVGFAVSNAPPLAWYDATNGEIGDICNELQGTFTGSDGASYVSQKMFSNTVGDCVTTRTATPAFTSPASASFSKGVFGTFTVTATGLPFPVLHEDGALPKGVSLVNSVLSGTPTQSGSFPITLHAKNSVTDTTQAFVLTVRLAPLITSASTTTFVKGLPGTFQVVASGYPAAHFSSVGILPSGVTLTAGGVLSGSPKATGTSNFSIVANNGVLPNSTQPFVLKVVSILITTVTLGTATRGKSYSLQLAHLGGVPGFVWSITTPKLPRGLSISRSGKITGTVRQSVAPGTYSVGVAVHDSAKPIQQKAATVLKLIVK